MPPSVRLDQLHDVETPEQVELSYTIAGLGSRLFAGLVDLLLIVAGMILLLLAMAALNVVGALRSGLPLANAGASWAFAILILAQFALMWGYYVLWEGLADGRTPGKRLLRLRVVHDDGLSITFGASAIRNILRIVDLQPGILAAVGIVSIAMSPRGKRIGDIVAGTIVVRERPVSIGSASDPTAAAPPLHGEPVLAGPEFELLARYVARRASLKPAERDRLAALVTGRLRRHLREQAPDNAVALQALYERESALRARGVAARSDTGAAREQHALVLHGRRRWSEFSRLLERAQARKLSGLTEEEVSEFAARYREISADLARLKTATRGRLTEDLFQLGRLAAAGHSLLYRRRRLSLDRALAFLATDPPREIRRSAGWVLAAAALFWIPAIMSCAGVLKEPDVARDFLPREMIDRAELVRASPEAGYVQIPELARPLFASAIVANNVQVSFAAFAFGITLGIGTVLLLLFNGVVIGGTAGLFAAKGAGHTLLAFVAPHGVLELSAIAIAGGAGLLIGGALLVPGPGGRRVTLVHNARRAISLMAAVILLLLVAGLIEGLVSPRPEPLAVKLAVAGATAIALALYIWYGGRNRSRSDRAATLDVEVPVDDGGAHPAHGNVHHGHA